MIKFLTSLPQRLRRVTASGGYNPAIDGLRFWAIVPVVLWHAVQRSARALPNPTPAQQASILWVPEGWIGVLLFFAVSGFIISSQFIRRRKQGGFVDLGAYFYRRVARIEPPYLILLIATYLLVQVGHFQTDAKTFYAGRESLAESFLASLVYLHGILFRQMPRLFPPGWSLEVEVQFYLLAPAIFALLYLARKRSARLAFGGIMLAVTLLIPHVFDNPLRAAGVWPHTIIRYFVFFWEGALIAEVNAEELWPPLSRAAWDVLSFAGLALFFWAGVIYHQPWGIGELQTDTMFVIAFFAMFGGALNGGLFRALCGHPWISLIGGACYSIYLSHLQVLQVLTPLAMRVLHPRSLAMAEAVSLLVGLPAVLCVGLLVYAFVERPFMIPDWPRRLWGRLAGVSKGAAADPAQGGAGPAALPAGAAAVAELPEKP